MGELVAIRTRCEALRHADKWESYAHQMESLLALVTAQRDASELLLKHAEAEVERLRALL